MSFMSYLQLHFHQCRGLVSIFLAICVLSLNSTASAQMNIEITGVGQTLYPIAVMRFQNEAKLPTSVTDIIRQDLARSGYFKNTENGNATESDEGTPNYKTWAARGADALVVGSVEQKSATNFEIRYKLFDIRKAQSLNGLVLTASADNLRQVAHKIADDIKRMVELEIIDTGGIGGTLAGNALSLASMRATLTQVLTQENFNRMIDLGTRWSDGVDGAIKEFDLPWTCNRLGARGEYMFGKTAPVTGADANNAGDFELEQYIHLRMLNDGFLITPFHNMALMCPDTTAGDVDAHTKAFRAMCAELVR